MTKTDQQRGRTPRDDMVDMVITGMVVTTALTALKAATDEEFRSDISRRQELRKELSAPGWVPYAIEPYYNIATWRGRVAFFVLELSTSSPINWFRYPVLRKLASWSVDHDAPARWELHEDWPDVDIIARGKPDDQ